MTNVTIRRCPVCPTIGSHVEELAAELRNDPDMNVSVRDGVRGEFDVEVGWRLISGKQGEAFRTPAQLAADIRGGYIETRG